VPLTSMTAPADARRASGALPESGNGVRHNMLKSLSLCIPDTKLQSHDSLIDGSAKLKLPRHGASSTPPPLMYTLVRKFYRYAMGLVALRNELRHQVPFYTNIGTSNAQSDALYF
jgi:hypothetical protein